MLDSLASGAFDGELTDEAVYTRFLKAAHSAGYLRAPEVESSFNLSVSVRAASPVIEAHYHYYKDTLGPGMGGSYKGDCSVWLHWNGKQVCDGGEVEKLISSAISGSEGAQKRSA